MSTYLTEYVGEYGVIMGGPRIEADSWDHALIRLEYSLAVEESLTGTCTELYIIGELVEEIEVEDI